MFVNIIVVLSTLAIFTAAAPDGLTGVCKTGTLQCCDLVAAAKSKEAKRRAGMLGVDVKDLDGNVGFQCNPISLANVAGGTNCGTDPVCCQGSKFNGLVYSSCVVATV